MRQWVQVFTLTHKNYIKDLASDYFKSKGLQLTTWLTSLKSSHRADMLRLFLLAIITETHCFVHTKHGYWSTLQEEPDSHLQYVKRCNLHLSYIGNGMFMQHEFKMESVYYGIFGVSDPIQVDVETTTHTVGELTADESNSDETTRQRLVTCSTVTALTNINIEHD